MGLSLDLQVRQMKTFDLLSVCAGATWAAELLDFLLHSSGLKTHLYLLTSGAVRLPAKKV